MEKIINKNEIAYYINDCKEAFVAFNITNNILTVTKTYVSDSLRGQGIARKLMDDVMAYAKREGYQVMATCSYAIKYLSEKNI